MSFKLLNIYNWSVDEKKFKNIQEIIDFLKQQAEVIWVKISDKKDKFGNIVIKTKLEPNIHPVRKVFLEHYLEERIGGLRISIIEEKS